MSNLLIAMLGGAAEGEQRHGHRAARFRLPAGERIVETTNLGIELARALQCDKLHLVGTPGAYFDRLLDLLPNSEQEAPVKETAPVIAKEEPAPSTESEAPGDTTSADEGTDSEASPESGDESNTGSDSEPENSSDTSDESENATEGEPEVQDAAEGSAEANTATANADQETDAPTPAEETAPATFQVKHHEPDLRSLSDRIHSQVASRRPDRDAMTALAERLQAALGISEVRCELISNPVEGRSFVAAIRSIAELPADGDTVHIDVTYGARSFPTLGAIAMSYFREFRPEITTGHVYEGSMDSADPDKVCTVVTLDGPVEFMDWMASFRDVRDGRAPRSLQSLFNQDRRFQRGIEFGALSETVEGARLLEERRRRLGRLPYAHPYRLFDKVLARTVKPLLSETSASALQFRLAQQDLETGHLPQAALHLREAVVSWCIEAYKRNPTRAWIDVPQSGGAQQVRPRDVAAYILSTPQAIARAPELGTLWPLLSTARNRYVNTSPTTVPASQLKDQDHEIRRSFELATTLIGGSQLDGIDEEVKWDNAVKQAIDLRLVRPREGRRPRRGNRKRGEGGGGRAPSGDRPPRQSGDRPPRRKGKDEDRPPRKRRPDGDRPPRRESQGVPRPDPADSTPRVTTARGGVGNFGKALADAGLRGQRGEKKDVKDAPPETPPQDTAAEPAPPAPAPAPPAADSPTETDAQAPSSPPEQAPGFDVAGPGDPPKDE